jgi:hypothetical protein
MITRFPGLLAAAAASSVEGDANWVSLAIRELGRSQAKEFLLTTIGWSLLGALIGVLVAVAAYMLFRWIGWYDTRTRAGTWGRRGVLVLTVLVTAVLIGLAGFWSGVIWGTSRAHAQPAGHRGVSWIAVTVATAGLVAVAASNTKFRTPDLTVRLSVSAE